MLFRLLINPKFLQILHFYNVSLDDFRPSVGSISGIDGLMSSVLNDLTSTTVLKKIGMGNWCTGHVSK
jgi:hypothetical protein